jgi:hypothetical protein
MMIDSFLTQKLLREAKMKVTTRKKDGTIIETFDNVQSIAVDKKVIAMRMSDVEYIRDLTSFNNYTIE